MVLKSHRIHHNGRNSNTQAFSIELPKHNVSQIIPILKEATKDTKDFVTFQMRRRNPDAFQGAIRYQNHLLSKQHVVVINSIGTEAMYYLTDRIQAISGVVDVVPTRTVDKTGRYYVIVNKDKSQQVRDKLLKKFDQWYTDVVPEDARPKTDQYFGPPTIGISGPDGFSDGDNSWITNSTRSFMSFSVESMQTAGATDEAQVYLDRAWETPTISPIPRHSAQSNPRPEGKKYASYAAAATVSDQVSGITESEPSPRDARHDELCLKIAGLEALVASLCQQVQMLTSSPKNNTSSAFPDTGSPVFPQEKRQDTKSTPRKSKRSHDQTAHSEAAEGSQEFGPMDDDHRTAWDDYETTNDHA
jgi:hypothetical protein